MDNSPPASPCASEISVGAPSPPPQMRRPKRRRSTSPTPAKPVKSFSIADILRQDGTTEPQTPTAAPRIVRPWAELLAPLPTAIPPFINSPALLHYEHRLALDYHRSLQEHFYAQAQLLRQMHLGMDVAHTETGSEVSSSAESDSCSPGLARLSGEGVAKDKQSRAGATAAGGARSHPNGTPLDALFQLSNKDFHDAKDTSHVDLFSNRSQVKKKRKSRTAFSNHQIFELEKRFLYQKYLSPADRDEIASSLGLSNAQVITWFQNRRAKQKRDIEEIKKDVQAVNTFSSHKSFLENVHDLSILKKKPVAQDK